MKIKPQTAIMSVLAIFAAGIILTSITGLWQTKTTKIPSKIGTGQFQGQYDPADIRGSYTFSDVSRLYGIPLEDLATAFGISKAEAQNFKCKDLETIYGDSTYEIGTASVKLYTAYYLGLPYEPTEDTYLTSEATEILITKGLMTPTQLAYLKTHTLAVD